MRKPDSLRLPILRQGPVPSLQQIDQAVSVAVDHAMEDAVAPGMFFSGGVDSTILLALILKYKKLLVFTVANSHDHPDMAAAKRIAAEWDMAHFRLIPTQRDIERARRMVETRVCSYPGDVGVYLACELAAAQGIKTLLATDGIDELTGGYWWHANLGERFITQEAAFEHFWSRVWDDHLVPLLESADAFGLDVRFPFLDTDLVKLFTQVPFTDRAGGGETKKLWKALAKKYVPAWVIERPKLGFVAALSWGE